MEKTAITAEKFEKKIEEEAAYLIHFNNLQRNKAYEVATQIVSEKFAVTA